MSVFCSSEMLGSVTGMKSRSPSLRGGMNSFPIRVARNSAPLKRASAKIIVIAR